MVLLSRQLLFNILRKDTFWKCDLNLEVLETFKKELEDQYLLAFQADEKCLKCLRAELFRIRTKGKIAKSKGGHQFQKFLQSLNSQYCWNVPVNRHESEILIENKLKEKDIESSAILAKCKSDFKKQLQEKEAEKQKLEQTFCEYLKSNINSKSLKRKPFQDCTVSVQSKRRKLETEMCGNALQFLEDMDVKPVSVIVSRHGKEEVLHLFQNEKENTDVDDLNTLVYILDAFNVSREAYHEISMLFKVMPRISAIKQYIGRLNQKFDIVNTPDGLGVQQSFRQRLKDVMTLLLSKNVNFVADGKLIVKISGDGTKIGKRIHVVNVTFTIVNESRSGSAQGNYLLCIARTKENYIDLSLALKDLRKEVEELQGNSIDICHRRFTLTIMLGGDYKFLLVAVGIPSIASKHVCLYCKCEKSERFCLNKFWSMTDESHGARLGYSCCNVKKNQNDDSFSVKNEPLFPCIDATHVVIDHLHMFLRIFDKLFSLLIGELRLCDNVTSSTTFSVLDKNMLKHVCALETGLKMLGIDFELCINKDTKKLDHRELTGPEKLKFLDHFNAGVLFADKDRASCIQTVWNNFRELNDMIKEDFPNPDDVDKKAKEWCKMYVDTYQARDITPYIHVLNYHVSELIRLHGNIIKYSQQGLEKLNDTITKQFFRSTGHKSQSALKQIMEKQNRMTVLENFKRVKSEKLCSNCKESGHTLLTCKN